MKLTITGYSTALFSTWYFIEELGLLFDAGDGLCAALLQKSKKIDHVFISHADRDHLTGLLQFNQLNARNGLPIIHYPKDCGSFPFMEAFFKKFDPHTSGTVWQPIIDGEKTWIRKDIYVQAIRNSHVAAPENKHKSLGYKVVQVTHKLNPELIKLSGIEIKKAIEAAGKAATHTEIHQTLVCYSGDTPVENFEHWHGAKVLIHEATFLQEEGATGNKHSCLEDVIKAVAAIKVEKLILGHFSSRYSAELIDAKIQEFCLKYDLKIPVFRILPSQTVWDVLNQPPIFSQE